jgi:hypothetical protein
VVTLLDCTFPGEGPPCHEIAWYLALNCARLPRGHTKETTIADFRAALERHGVDTASWWDRQLGLCLLGSVVQFGWKRRSEMTRSWVGGVMQPGTVLDGSEF